jgi:hypothetical protein
VTVTVWEAIFMLLVLKIPLVYLGVVVLWAVRAEPDPAAGYGDEATVLAPIEPCGWSDWNRGRARPLGRRPRPTPPRVRARAYSA